MNYVIQEKKFFMGKQKRLKYKKSPIQLVDESIVFLPEVRRVEVIDGSGRAYVNWDYSNRVEISLQDDGRTLKIFISQIVSEEVNDSL